MPAYDGRSMRVKYTAKTLGCQIACGLSFAGLCPCRYNGDVKKPLLAAALLLGLALGLALAALAAWGRGLPNRANRAECPATDIPLSRDKALGVNADLSLLSPIDRRSALDSMRSLGLSWVRQRFPWDRIELQRGFYDWATWDGIVSDVAHQGMTLVAVLDGSPAWARPSEDTTNPLAPPSEVKEFGAFAAAFAGRYGDQIDVYQLWDEPNIAPHWGNRWVDPSGYARLLREGAIQVRTADPGSVVVLAGLAPNTETGGANLSDVLYLDALYGLNAAEWFDVVAAEPYGFDAGATEPSLPGRLGFSRAEQIRAVMQQRGDEGTPVWAVAFGWQTKVNHDLTSERLYEAEDYARKNWPWMGPMLWAAWSPEDVHGQYALTNLTATLAALQESRGSLVGETGRASAGWYPADHPSGRYEGSWRVTPEGADIGATGDRLEIAFKGTRIDLMVRKGDYRAFLYVTVDGQPAGALPRDGDGQSYVVLYDPRGGATAVTLAEGLDEGEHVAQLEAEGGWGQWAIVGWGICSETASEVPLTLFLLWAGSAVALACACGAAWLERPVLLGFVRSVVAGFRRLDTRLACLIGAAASLCVYLAADTGPTLVALLLLAIVIALRPEVGLLLIALSLPFCQLTVPVFGKAFSLVEILTWMTAAGFLAQRVLGRRQALLAGSCARTAPSGRLAGLTSLDWGVFGLVAVGALSLFWAEHTREAAREFRTVLLGSATFYLLLRTLARDKAVRWAVSDSWVLGSALVALIAVGQWILGRDLITADGVLRARGLYGSPNNLAIYLGRSLPLSLAVGLWHGKGRRKSLYSVAAGLLIAAIGLTYSRGAWLLGVPASLLFLSAARGRRALLVAGGTALAGGLLALALIGTGRLASVADLAQGTTFLRLQVWQSSLAMIRDHPILGVGLDGFLYAYRSTYILPTAWEEFNLSHPHNIVLDFWLRLGLPGLLVVGYVMIVFFRDGWRVYKRWSRSEEGLLALGLMAGMVAFLVHGMVDNAFFLVDLAFAFVLMLALVQPLAEHSPSADTEQP